METEIQPENFAEKTTLQKTIKIKWKLKRPN